MGRRRKRRRFILGSKILTPKRGPCHNLFLRGPILGSKFWTPKWGPPGVMFSVPARFPKTFSASKSVGLHRHGWLRVSPFCLAVTLIAAANVAFLRTVVDLTTEPFFVSCSGTHTPMTSATNCGVGWSSFSKTQGAAAAVQQQKRVNQWTKGVYFRTKNQSR